MSGNEIVNAGFAEGFSFWTTSGQVGPAVVDEKTLGFDGRLVLTVTGSTDPLVIAQEAARAIPVTTGQVLEVFGHHGGLNATTVLRVQFSTNSTFTAGLQEVTVPVVKKGDGRPRLGLAKSFDFSHKRITSPLAGYARIRVVGTPTGPNPKLALMKPYMERVLASTKYRCWDPGVHVNPDLQLPIWPAELPHLRAESFSAPVIPTRTSFSGDKGVAITKKFTRTPWYTVTGQLRGDQETHAILDQFFREAPEPFWFVRPDTLQLCQATWLAEGEPSMTGLGPDKTIQFSLQLSVY